MDYESKNKTYDQRFVREEQRTYELRTDGQLARKRERFRLIDAFSGAGGMTLGFSKRFGHVFDSVWANDFNNYCVEPYNTNFGERCLSGDIVDILNSSMAKIPEADVVIGGPPCQGFSLLT
ncbi:MAG: DNA cytosine methyltransferase [Deltaproteobacteria bacterium]|nr:DNA cytosine methyltransferase [Deltaproteobacteria bacterium]